MSDTNRSHNMEYPPRRGRPSQICDAFEQLTGGEKLSKADAGRQFYPDRISDSSRCSTVRMSYSPHNCVNTVPGTRSHPLTDHNLRTHGRQHYTSDSYSFKKKHSSGISSDYYDGPSAYYLESTLQDEMHRQTSSHNNPTLRSDTLKIDVRPQTQYPSDVYEDCERYADSSSLLRNKGADVNSKSRKKARVTRDHDGRLQLERGVASSGRDPSMSRADKIALGFAKYVVGDY